MDVAKGVWAAVDGYKSKLLALVVIASGICEMMGYHQFSQGWWTMLAGGGAYTFRDALDKLMSPAKRK